MPHLVCEYSSDHSPAVVRELLHALHGAAASTEIVKGKDLKIRGRPYDEYIFAGKIQSFFHLGLYLNAGRTMEQKRVLSRSLLHVLTNRLPETVSVSVDIRDMERGCYSRRVLE
jgi:5-carboxymethyl-2-hydroxymuconate isomerase